MSRKISHLLEIYGIEEEFDPKIKFNCLLSVAVSTIMCIAAKCPLPKSNVETTKLFLSTITDDNGRIPRNVKGLLSLLDDYSGPYDNLPFKENRFEKPPVEEAVVETEKQTSLDIIPVAKNLPSQEVGREIVSVEFQSTNKRNPKLPLKKNEKEQNKKGGKNVPSKVTLSKSLITSKT